MFAQVLRELSTYLFLLTLTYILIGIRLRYSKTYLKNWFFESSVSSGQEKDWLQFK